MYYVVDGDKRSPKDIAEISGLLGAGDVDVKGIVKKVIEEEFVTVNKIKKTKQTGPIMYLVGQVMKKLNRHGDPEEIKELIEDELDIDIEDEDSN